MGKPHETHAPHSGAEIDPEHDIDGRQTMIWMVVWTIAIFASVWLLYLLFKVANEAERRQKIDLIPTLELNELREKEAAILAGTTGGISIDEAIDRLLEAGK